jgi:hypothetical protein
MFVRGYDELARGDVRGVGHTPVFLLPFMIIPTNPSNSRRGKKKLYKEERLIAGH